MLQQKNTCTLEAIFMFGFISLILLELIDFNAQLCCFKCCFDRDFRRAITENTFVCAP